MTDPSQVSDYDVTARSTDIFGRVLCGMRGHHFIIDGPVQNGAPGEEVTPVEAFLSRARCSSKNSSGSDHSMGRSRSRPLRWKYAAPPLRRWRSALAGPVMAKHAAALLDASHRVRAWHRLTSAKDSRVV